MLPYQGVALDYAGYQRQSSGVPGGPMGMGPLGMSVGGPPFTHSWLVPTQELCAVPYKQMPNQHQNAVMHSNQQSIEPGHVYISFKFFSYCYVHFIHFYSIFIRYENL